MERLTQKTSTILISVGNRTRVYRSVAEVPPRLRRKLLESTSGAQSATVLIADEMGRKEILRSLQGLPTALESRLIGGLLGKVRSGDNAGFRMTWRHWAEIGLLCGIGLCIWLLSVWK